MILSTEITIKAYGPAELFDLSGEVDGFLRAAGATDGFAHLFSIGSTGAIVGLVPEAAARRAFIDWVIAAVPFSADHRHPGNAFAHLRSSFLKPARWVPVAGGHLQAPAPHLLENTAGRKSRPIVMTWFGDSRDSGGTMSHFRGDFEVEANGWIDLVDLTPRVAELTRRFGVARGQALVAVDHERAAVISIENDMRLILDTADFIDRLVRKRTGVDVETAGHIAAAVLSQSLAVPIIDGRLELGTWQQVMLVDLAEAGDKRVTVDIIGE